MISMEQQKRYENLIEAALEIRCKKVELERLKTKLSENITLSELNGNDYIIVNLKRAFRAVDELLFDTHPITEYMAKYKDIHIPLYCDPKLDPRKAMKEIMEEVRDII